MLSRVNPSKANKTKAISYATKVIAMVFAVIILPLTCFVACGGSEVDGEYRFYEMQNEIATKYYSMTLKKDKYTFVEVNTILGETTTTVKSQGKFTYSDDGTIAFVEGSGTEFSGSLVDGILDFIYKHEEFVLR